MGNNVTIRDVAEASGFSIYTVSCVLNNKGRISESTRRTVQEAIRQLNYDPLRNFPLARSLTARTIGLVLPNVYSEGHPFYFRAVHTIRRFASEHDCDMKLFTTTDFAARIEANYERAAALGFDSLLVFCCDPPADALRDLADRNIPVAMVRRRMTHRGILTVTDDDRRGITLAMEHLHEHHGHTKIALFAQRFHEGVPRRRLDGYLAYVRAHKLGDDPRLRIERADLDTPLGDHLVALHAGGDLTAVVCISDGLAIQVSKALLRRGLRIPDDVAVTGYNNTRDAELFHPGITTVDVPVAAMVTAACRGLMTYDPATAPASATLEFENTLHVRESCGREADGSVGSV